MMSQTPLAIGYAESGRVEPHHDVAIGDIPSKSLVANTVKSL